MCNYNPELVAGPIGMFHCPQCGEMVIAGYPHPDYDIIDWEKVKLPPLYAGEDDAIDWGF